MHKFLNTKHKFNYATNVPSVNTRAKCRKWEEKTWRIKVRMIPFYMIKSISTFQLKFSVVCSVGRCTVHIRNLKWDCRLNVLIMPTGAYQTIHFMKLNGFKHRSLFPCTSAKYFNKLLCNTKIKDGSEILPWFRYARARSYMLKIVCMCVREWRKVENLILKTI